MIITCGWNRKREAGRRRRRWSPTLLILLIMNVKKIWRRKKQFTIIGKIQKPKAALTNWPKYEENQPSPIGTPRSLSRIGESVSCQVHLNKNGHSMRLFIKGCRHSGHHLCNSFKFASTETQFDSVVSERQTGTFIQESSWISSLPFH